MIKKNILTVLTSVLLTACLNNNLEETSIVDCKASNLDLTALSTDSNCGESNGTITATATEGQLPYQYSLENGGSNASGIFENLTSGNYNVTVFDASNCSVTIEVSIVNTGGFQATGTVTEAGCGTTNGSFMISPTGGVEPYNYQLNGGTSQVSDTFSGLGVGEHEVVVTDASGCDFSIIKMITTGVSYTTSIKPIITNSCATSRCHDGSTAQTNFTIFSNVQNSSSGIRSRTQSGNMPKNESLTQQEIDVIACWVDDGAKNN